MSSEKTIDPHRPLYQWKIAHILLNKEGKYTCLDLNIGTNSIEEMKDEILEMASKMSRESLLPISSEDKWERFRNAEVQPIIAGITELHELGLTRSRQITFVVRKEI